MTILSLIMSEFRLELSSAPITAENAVGLEAIQAVPLTDNWKHGYGEVRNLLGEITRTSDIP
jgi:hypothetical protein